MATSKGDPSKQEDSFRVPDTEIGEVGRRQRLGADSQEEEGQVMAVHVLYTRSDGKWAWRLKADNGQIIATDGGQGYNNEADARSMADRIIGGEFKDAEKKIIKPT